MSRRQKTSIGREILEWALAMVGTVVITLFILGNVVSSTGVYGESMEPTFHHGERIIDYRLGYMLSEPMAGDIVVLSKNKSDKGIIINMIEHGKDIVNNIQNKINNVREVKYIIKRVIAVPGDVVDIKDGQVYVNGKRLEEDYTEGKTYEDSDFTYPIVIPENHIFVLGDNRGNSLDSRQLGLFDFDQVKGKVVYRVWPINRFGKVK